WFVYPVFYSLLVFIPLVVNSTIETTNLAYVGMKTPERIFFLTAGRSSTKKVVADTFLTT
ncbi:Uncharacterized protein APZ42_010792, partial [Daphnia magna]